MPRVPEFSPVLADSRSLFAARADTSVDSASMAAIPGQQLERTGQAMLGISDSLLKIATKMQDETNQVRIDDSRNQLREAALSLAYDPEAGFKAQKGISALQRENGMSLADEYAQKLQDRISKLADNLGNDEQKRVFAIHANDMLTSFKGDVETHTLQEFKHYSLSVQDGAIKLGADEAKRNWSDPLKVDTALNSVKAAVVRAGQLQGESANETLAKMNVATSTVHLGVIDAALQNSNPTYAQNYFQSRKEGMTADDILKVNGAINRDLDARVAQQASTLTADKFGPRFQPTEIDRLKGVVLGLESGGKDFKADGTPVISGKGALYRMQTMPETAANPGFGIVPARDNSPAEYNRVGEQYLTAMVLKFGNTAQALAAYNAGPGKEGTNGYDEKGKPLPGLAPAMARAESKGTPNAWISELPAETQTYVKKGLAQLGAGMGAAPPPTISEYVQHAVSLLGPNPRPEQVKLTQAAAEHSYNLVTKSVNERRDQVMSQGFQALIANGGDWNSLDYGLKSAIAQAGPGKLDDVMKFAERIRKGPDNTNPELYLKLATYPEEAARMTDNQFMQLRSQLSESDFKHFTKERGDFINGKVDDGFEAINSKALTTALNSRLTSLGINPTPAVKDMEDRARVGTIQKYIRDDIFALQQQTGKKLTPAEIEKHVDTLFAKDLGFRKTFAGFEVGTSSQNMLTMKASDIPGDALKRIKQAFELQGVKAPTDDQVLRTYWTMKARNG